MEYLLLKRFEDTFRGQRYRHRDSSLGDRIASFLYDDLYVLAKSAKITSKINNREVVVNRANTITGKKSRRGDGTFGEIVPNSAFLFEKTYLVPRGDVATIEIGAEVKVLAKAMIKQIDRVRLSGSS